MSMNQLIGWLALAIGAVSATGYVLLAMGHTTPLFSKLEPMQRRLGKVPGLALHFAAYVILPLALAALLLLGEG